MSSHHHLIIILLYSVSLVTCMQSLLCICVFICFVADSVISEWTKAAAVMDKFVPFREWMELFWQIIMKLFSVSSFLLFCSEIATGWCKDYSVGFSLMYHISENRPVLKHYLSRKQSSAYINQLLSVRPAKNNISSTAERAWSHSAHTQRRFHKRLSVCIGGLCFCRRCETEIW